MSIDYLLSGDPQEKISWRDHATSGGNAVWGSRRSIAHLEMTNQEVKRRFHTEIVIQQSAYNTGVEASAGTHDYDAVYDCYLPGIDWFTAQKFFRELGWAAWYRFPPSFSAHIHMVSLGYTTRVGVYVPGQVRDYYEHKTGLVGHEADSSWHPSNIDATIFNYNEWKAKEGDDLPYSEAELKKIIKEAVREEAQTYRANQKKRYEKVLNTLLRKFKATDADLEEIKALMEEDADV